MTTAPQTGVPAASERPKPLTSPADLFQLLGRMLASFVLFWLTVFWIFRTSLEKDPKQFPPDLVMTCTTAAISLAVQLTTIKLWKRLRDERLAAEAERAEAYAAAAAAPSTEEASA